MQVPFSAGETGRLEALRRCDILDTAPEPEFDGLAHLAALICGTPMAAVSLIDRDRQWFKSRIGLEPAETPRSISFCTHTILEEDILLVPDAAGDDRFAESPLVTAEPYIRFYAGVPLVTSEDRALGALCVMDTVPRVLDPVAQDALRRLGRQAVALLEARPCRVPQEERNADPAAAMTAQALLAAIVESSDDAIVSKTLDGIITTWNAGATALYGYSPGEAIGRSTSMLAAPDHGDEENQLLARIAQGERVANYETVRLRKDGSRVDVSLTLSPIHSPAGEIVGASVIARDIGDRKRAEEALRESEERFRNLLQSIPSVSVQGYGPDGATRYWNDASEQIYGYSAREAIGRNLLDLIIPPEMQEGVRGAIQEMARTGQAIPASELTLMRKDGSRVTVFSSHAMVHVPGRTPELFCIDIDLTERKEAEAALQAAHDHLETRVEERTTEIQQANEELQAAKEAADKANRAKSEFLSRMSHELRTPLNAILGFGQILDKQELAPISRESVSYILKGGRHLLNLINEVLDIARVEAGRIELSLEPVAPDEVVPEACALLRPLADESDIRLDEKAAALVGSYVLADRQRLKQVLINLLSNAIKYNRRGGQVTVSCDRGPNGAISLAVRDTGPGIPPEDLPKLFTPFERLGASGSKIEGTGLGLALSQRLVTAMNGTLAVESVPGQGTTFTLSLPEAASPQERLADSLESLRLPESGRKAERDYSVLYIEDNLPNVRLLEVILQDRPEINLMVAMQGSVGLDLARQHEPDLVLLDLNLPDMHGRDVIARLRQSALTRDIPVVVVSADATPNQVERLLNAGASAYLTKPLDVGLFLRTLDGILRSEPEAVPPQGEDSEIS